MCPLTLPGQPCSSTESSLWGGVAGQICVGGTILCGQDMHAPQEAEVRRCDLGGGGGGVGAGHREVGRIPPHG